MGMYDFICGIVKCPKCGKKVEIEDQIKWTNNCLMQNYRVGDKIDAPDGVYINGSYVRNEMVDICEFCHTKISFTATVKDSILTEISVSGYKDS